MAQDPTEAAEKAVDTDRLLDGEDPESTVLEDAEHWVAVYEELTSFKGDVLGTTREHTEAMGRDATAEVLATDLPLLRAEAERLHRRLAFWRRRAEELRG